MPPIASHARHLRRLVAICMLSLSSLIIAPAAFAQAAVPVVTAVSGSNQSAAPGSPLPNPFRARVTAPGGQPLAGVSVTFDIEVAVPGIPPPGFEDDYGHFVTTAPVLTDANGIATSPVFITAVRPGTLNTIRVTTAPATIDGTPYAGTFTPTLFVVGQPPSSIPSLGVYALAGLGVLIFLLAGRRRRLAGA